MDPDLSNCYLSVVLDPAADRGFAVTLTVNFLPFFFIATGPGSRSVFPLVITVLSCIENVLPISRKNSPLSFRGQKAGRRGQRSLKQS
jgi:hypothetical protein